MIVLGELVILAAMVALWVAFGRRLRRLEEQLADLRILRRETERLRDDLDRGLAVTRMHVAQVAAGEAPPRDVIVKGRAWQDVQAAPAAVLYERDPALVVLDVRTEAEFRNGHIPRAKLVPVDELEDRVHELPSADTPMLVTCAAGGRSLAACEILAARGYTRLLNLVGGMHAWTGPVERDAAAPPPPPPPAGSTATEIADRGGPVRAAQVVDAIRQCFDPEIPLNVYDLGLVYGIDVDDERIAVKMTLTSESCPSARTIPEDVRSRIAALGQPNVTVSVVFDPPWHPTRISPEGKQKLGQQ